MSDERCFWVGMVLTMFLSGVVGKSGLLHHVWPDVFGPPAVCESDKKTKKVLSDKGPVAINSEAKEAAHA